jgi:hypothetical protein
MAHLLGLLLSSSGRHILVIRSLFDEGVVLVVKVLQL